MKMMFETVDMIGDKLAKALGEKLLKADALNVREWAQKYTGDVIGNVAFGLDCQSKSILS